jgi:hypothetical protein
VESARVQKTADQIACDIGGEVVILDLKSGTYFGVDDLGARIWSLLEQPTSVVAIRDAIMAEYDVDASTCERDIITFIQQMEQAGLVEVTHGSAE